MFRLWARTVKNSKTLKDLVIEDNSHETRTHKVFNALEKICLEFDLSKPIWLDKTINDFKYHNKARFSQDNFIEEIDFDYLEIRTLED
ncbi:hypothetical protein SAMN05216249_10697 [Acetitomaculum ruminis DSM 5522]|uniref:Uncharacterized protein n=1 Tax=Acetitomaculum ruminis DSM 5522 TaxID=1120918 RepID=A0A1I0XEZ6_9FIRM|nr:hypothetical protein [Acetitomaculum ruminis]SFA98838.1 hypothetical protein SAMN05216249_10697 [Acetitomaculum ruminis DSM 5522]